MNATFYSRNTLATADSNEQTKNKGNLIFEAIKLPAIEYKQDFLEMYCYYRLGLYAPTKIRNKFPH